MALAISKMQGSDSYHENHRQHLRSSQCLKVRKMEVTNPRILGLPSPPTCVEPHSQGDVSAEGNSRLWVAVNEDSSFERVPDDPSSLPEEKGAVH